MNIQINFLTYDEYFKIRMQEIANEVSSATVEDKEGYTDEEYEAMQYVDVDIDAEYNYYVNKKIEEFRTHMETTNRKVPYSDVSELRFNNFKPFGGKLQSFSKKPITLIYGQNSIGKSSFIHMSAYLRYIFKTESFDLRDTDMFGDEINLGGFEKFVHKRDKNNTITFEFSFDDCAPQIIEYLGLSSIDFTHIEALHSFTKEEIIDIINNSKKYVNNCEVCSGVCGFSSDDRSRNKLCSKIYRDEFEYFNHSYGEVNQEDYAKKLKKLANIKTDFIISDDKKLSFFHGYYNKYLKIDTFLGNYYKYYPYKKAYEEISTYDRDKEDMPSHKFYTNEGDFHNGECKDCFISEVLIPNYINFSKYLLVDQFSKNKSNWSEIDLHSNEIDIIADNTIKMIDTIYELFTYRKLLESKKIPLKISMEIGRNASIKKTKQYTGLSDIRLKRTKYIIGNTLYDAAEEVMLKDSDGNPFYVTAAASYDYENFDLLGIPELTNGGEFGHPEIFDSAPYICQRLLFNCKLDNFNIKNRVYQREFEKNNSIFLSYRKGYNKLIGLLNDMIHFKFMQYIGPLRFYPERESYFKELPTNSLAIPNSLESWSMLKKDSKLRDRINEWLKNPDKLKTPYEIRNRRFYDIESFLFRLDFEKFMELKITVDGYNKKIEKLNLININEDKIVEYIVDLFHEREKTDMYSNASPREIEKEILYLKKFSQLNEQEQYIQVFKEMDIFDDVESREELVFKDLKNDTQISNRDLGLGISQILPVLIATNGNKNMTIAVEQPELHLHPAVQSEIADEFIRSYKENNNEFLIETHSEHLLLRIMKRMRHTAEDKKGRDKALDLTPDDVCLLYVDNDGESTFINELELDRDGTLLDPWPNGFFEEGHRERFD